MPSTPARSCRARCLLSGAARWWQRTQHHRSRFASAVCQCARRCCAPHRCRGVTSPVLRKYWSVRCGAVMVSARLRIVLDQPSPTARPGSRGVRCSVVHPRYGHPLRGPSGLHKAALPSVPASRCAKAPLGAGHRFAPRRVKATGVMQSGLRWSRSHSRRRSPFASRPTHRCLRALVAVVALWH